MLFRSGMGDHTAESLQETIISSANAALQRYPAYASYSFETYVDVQPIAYNDLFEEERARLKEGQKKLSDYFGGQAGYPSVVELEAKLSRDDFFNSHILDVLLYGSLHCEVVRARFAKRLNEEFAKATSAQTVHVLAHSLGTAAMHDTLHKLYSEGMKDDEGNWISLNSVDNRIDSLWMIANVSNLMFQLNPLKTTINPFSSLVRPSTGVAGCTEQFFNVWHQYDPFTLAHEFDPKENGWVHPALYKELYTQITTTHLHHSLNPHSLTNYLLNPLVSYPFLRTMMSGVFAPSEEDISRADQIAETQRKSVAGVMGETSGLSSADTFLGYLDRVEAFKKYLTTE